MNHISKINRIKKDAKSFLFIGILLLLAVSLLIAKSVFSEKPTDLTTFSSEKAHFAVDLPSNMNMLELENNYEEDGFYGGSVYFSSNSIDEDNPHGMTVIYGVPNIPGGGACIDDNGEPAEKSEIIANQEVSVCEEGAFRAGYFKHPQREIEYQIIISTGSPALSEAEVDELVRATKETFRFE